MHDKSPIKPRPSLRIHSFIQFNKSKDKSSMPDMTLVSITSCGAYSDKNQPPNEIKEFISF